MYADSGSTRRLPMAGRRDGPGVVSRRGFMAAAGFCGAAGSILRGSENAATRPARKQVAATRGVVLLPGDLTLSDWPERVRQAGLTTIGIHDPVSPRNIVRFVQSERGRKFLEKCRELGLEVEYELHAMSELLPRALFKDEPALSRMDEKGERTADANLCISSERALRIAEESAVEIAGALRPTTHRYFFWGDDGRPWCRCPQCSALSESDQALVLENRLIEGLRKADPLAKLAHLAYANTLAPPKKIKPRPRIFLEFAPIQRRYDIPFSKEDDAKNREALDALKGNLAVFGAEDAQALEYWLDCSRFSGYRKPAVKVPFVERAFLEDLETYGSLGIRRLTTFAVYIDADYVKRHGEPPLEAYGRGLLGWRKH